MSTHRNMGRLFERDAAPVEEQQDIRLAATEPP